MEETHDTIESNDEYNNVTSITEQTDATTTTFNGIHIQQHTEHFNKSEFDSYGSSQKEDFPVKAEQQLQEILKSQEDITKIMACTMSTSAQCLQQHTRSIQATTSKQALEKFNEYEQKVNEKNAFSGMNLTPIEEILEEPPDSLQDSPNINDATPTSSIRSIGSLVCRICHNSENPEALVSPCLCKGSLTYVHVHCLERWISTSRSTICELCQFQYNTEQTLRYSCLQSLRMWYSRSMSRRALQEDCQMFSLLTLIAFAIVGTLLVGIQFYFFQGHTTSLTRIWTKGWLVFFLFTTLSVYVINVYMIVKTQLTPWYRWWQSARDIKLILENRNPFQLRHVSRKSQQEEAISTAQNLIQHPQPALPLSTPQLQGGTTLL